MGGWAAEWSLARGASLTAAEGSTVGEARDLGFSGGREQHPKG